MSPLPSSHPPEAHENFEFTDHCQPAYSQRLPEQSDSPRQRRPMSQPHPPVQEPQYRDYRYYPGWHETPSCCVQDNPHLSFFKAFVLLVFFASSIKTVPLLYIHTTHGSNGTPTGICVIIKTMKYTHSVSYNVKFTPTLALI